MGHSLKYDTLPWMPCQNGWVIIRASFVLSDSWICSYGNVSVLGLSLWISAGLKVSRSLSHVMEEFRGFCVFLAQVKFCHKVFWSFKSANIPVFLFLRSANTSKQVSHDRCAWWNTILWKNSWKKDRRRLCLLCPAVSSGGVCMCEAEDDFSLWAPGFCILLTTSAN